MINYKRVIKLTAVLLVALLAVSGCKKDKKSEEKNKNADSVSETAVKVEEEEYVNCFDVVDMASKIKINDQEMTFPIDMTKLKQSISLGALEQVMPSHLFRGVLMDGENGIGVVELYSESGDPSTDGFIHFLEIKEGSPWYLSIGGVTFGAGVDAVKNEIGAPIFENGTMEDTYRLYYENCKYEYLAFTFKQGRLTTISFEYLPAEWRAQ